MKRNAITGCAGWAPISRLASRSRFTFCRFTKRGNVGELFVIADNHDRRAAHAGSYTVRGQATCPSRRSVTRTAAPA
jgi:3',5'-cyclic AMP phosphodiesterase CpdA